MILTFITTVLFLLATSGSATDTSSTTKKELSVLIQKSVSALRDGKLCQAAFEIVRTAANANPNILPNYTLIFDYRDDSPDYSNTLRELFRYYDGFVDGETTNATAYSNRVLSPLILVSGSVPVCQSLGAFAHKLDLAVLTDACQDPQFTAQRHLYPNLWRITMSWENFVIPTVQFVTRFGNWTKVGILTDASNSVVYTVSSEINEWLGRENVNVVYNQLALDLGSDETINQLSASDARIIIVYAGNLAILFPFYCAAYKAGIRGSKYVFIHTVNIFTSVFNGSPLSLPPGCTRQMLKEQISLSFRIGQVNIALFNNGPTSLGYDLTEFEQLFDANTNSSRTADYDNRHECYDWGLNAVMALDLAESKLQNMSLSLSDWKNQPDLVAGVVNSSLLEVQYRDLRSGPVVMSPRAEREENIQEIFQNINGKDIVNYKVRNVKHIYGVENFDMDTFGWELLSNVVWQSGPNPPADFPQFLTTVIDIPIGVFGMVVTLATLLTIGQVVLLLRQKQRYKIMLYMRLEVSWFFVNGAAVLFSVPFTICPFVALCYAQRVVLIVGSSFLLGLFAGLSIPIFRGVRKLKDILITADLTNQIVDATTNFTARVSFSFSNFFATVLPFVVSLIVWLSLDKFDISPNQIGSESYDLSSDAYIKTFVRGCSSNLGDYFAAGLLGLYSIELSVASLIAYKSMTDFRSSNWKSLQLIGLNKTTVRCLFISVWTLLGVSFPAILIIALLKLTNGPAISSIVLSLCLLFASACLTLAWNMPLSWAGSMFQKIRTQSVVPN